MKQSSLDVRNKNIIIETLNNRINCFEQNNEKEKHFIQNISNEKQNEIKTLSKKVSDLENRIFNLNIEYEKKLEDRDKKIESFEFYEQNSIHLDEFYEKISEQRISFDKEISRINQISINYQNDKQKLQDTEVQLQDKITQLEERVREQNFEIQSLTSENSLLTLDNQEKDKNNNFLNYSLIQYKNENQNLKNEIHSLSVYNDISIDHSNSFNNIENPKSFVLQTKNILETKSDKYDFSNKRKCPVLNCNGLGHINNKSKRHYCIKSCPNTKNNKIELTRSNVSSLKKELINMQNKLLREKRENLNVISYIILIF